MAATTSTDLHLSFLFVITYVIGMMLGLVHDHPSPFKNGILTIPLTRELTSIAHQLIFFALTTLFRTEATKTTLVRLKKKFHSIPPLTLHLFHNALQCSQTRLTRFLPCTRRPTSPLLLLFIISIGMPSLPLLLSHYFSS